MNNAQLRVSVPLRGSGDERAGLTPMVRSVGSKFQSPCGEVVMKANDILNGIRDELIVSVPLRGSGDESTFFINRNAGAIDWSFQSPCGEVVMKVVHFTHFLR